jgi:hypothetical protein
MTLKGQGDSGAALAKQGEYAAFAEPDMPLSILLRTIDVLLAALVVVAFS